VEEEAIIPQQARSKIVVVIPTLNESKAVGKVVGGVKHVMADYDCTVLIIDGHSTDGTDQIAKEKAQPSSTSGGKATAMP
jgi:glycosyltransferase involved in cell wall biosynthesis